MERAFACGNLYEDENSSLLSAVQDALHAHALLRRDIDYIVQNSAIESVDEFKGRIAQDRRWPAGLHAASPLYMAEPAHGTVVLAVGGDETGEFHAQSARFAQAWAARVAAMLRPAGRDHFSIVDDLRSDDSELAWAAMGLFSSEGPLPRRAVCS